MLFEAERDQATSNSVLELPPTTPIVDAPGNVINNLMSPIEKEIRDRWQERTVVSGSSFKHYKGKSPVEEDSSDGRSVVSASGTKLNEEDLQEFKDEKMKQFIRIIKFKMVTDTSDRFVNNSNDKMNVKNIVTGIKDQKEIDQQMILKVIEDFFVIYPVALAMIGHRP